MSWISFRKHYRANWISVIMHEENVFSWNIFHTSGNIFSSMWFLAWIVTYIQFNWVGYVFNWVGYVLFVEWTLRHQETQAHKGRHGTDPWPLFKYLSYSTTLSEHAPHRRLQCPAFGRAGTCLFSSVQRDAKPLTSWKRFSILDKSKIWLRAIAP